MWLTMIDTRQSIAGFDIAKVEKRYSAIFIGDFPVKLKSGGWGDAGAVFYQPNPDVSKGHSHYFGLVLSPDLAYWIYDAAFIEGKEFIGVKQADGSYVWSRFRHDFREVEDGFIDGGFDYTRIGGNPKTVTLKVEKDKIVEATSAGI